MLSHPLLVSTKSTLHTREQRVTLGYNVVCNQIGGENCSLFTEIDAQ